MPRRVRPLEAGWIGPEDIGSRNDRRVGPSECICIMYEGGSTLSCMHVQGIPGLGVVFDFTASRISLWMHGGRRPLGFHFLRPLHNLVCLGYTHRSWSVQAVRRRSNAPRDGAQPSLAESLSLENDRLERIDDMVNWERSGQMVIGVYSGREGRPGYPPREGRRWMLRWWKPRRVVRGVGGPRSKESRGPNAAWTQTHRGRRPHFGCSNAHL